MNGKSLVMLVLAVVCGLGAMVGTSRMLRDRKKPEARMRDVLVATRDLKIEEVLKPDLVRVQQMPESNLPPGAFASFKDVEDRWIQISTLEGEPIVDRKLAPKGSPAGLVARIPKGMRAFAIEVNEQSGVSGFVLPDHRVDVIQVETQGNGPALSETILQDVLVLASGQVFTRPEDRSIQARTVTLSVTPDQADQLVAARAKGPLALTLRGLNDHVHSVRVPKPTPTPSLPAQPVDEPAVVAAKPVEPPPSPPPSVESDPKLTARKKPIPRYVFIYRGVGNSRDEQRIDKVSLKPGNEEVDPEQDDQAFPVVGNFR